MERLVSVIIPTYNRSAVISKAIESVIAQTYEPVEIIIVDDGSTDNTEDKLADYAGKIKYLYKKNGGCSSARNLGIKEANGEYVAFLDSDDAWYPQKLEKQVEKLSQNKDYGMVFSEIELIDEDNEHISYSKWRNNIKKDGDILLDFLKNPAITCSCLLVRKDVLSEVGFFDEQLSTGEDIDMVFRICSKYKAMLIDEPLVRYKKGKDSLSNNLFTKNRLKAIEKIKQYNKEFIEENKDVIAETAAKIHLDYAVDLLWYRYITEARGQIRESMRNQFTQKALIIYMKSLVMSFLSCFLAGYKDKGNINGK